MHRHTFFFFKTAELEKPHDIKTGGLCCLWFTVLLCVQVLTTLAAENIL